jgi:hypothetical protein
LLDYGAIYRLPGLYEQLFATRLECSSPQRVVAVFEEVLRDWEVHPSELRVLEVGAGNGMVGDELRFLGVGELIGVDILHEAAAAAHRDRPMVYDDYLVTDLCDTANPDWTRIASIQPNCLVAVAALGLGEISPTAFVNAFNAVSIPSWIVYNVEDSLLGGVNDNVFARLIRGISEQGFMQVQCCRRYCHRLSVSGQRLHYLAIVARKLKPIPQMVLERSK